MRTPRPASLRSKGILLLLILWLLGNSLLRTAPAFAADASTENQVKAAFVYNFAKFTEWPASSFESPQAPITLCVAGVDESHARALAGLERKPVQGREIRVKRNPAVAEIGECEILYVGDEEPRRVQSALQAAKGLSVLTVSDNEGFADTGGMIGLVYADSRIQFEVNLGAVQKAGLKIAAQALKIARAVKEGKN